VKSYKATTYFICGAGLGFGFNGGGGGGARFFTEAVDPTLTEGVYGGGGAICDELDGGGGGAFLYPAADTDLVGGAEALKLDPEATDAVVDG